MAFLKMTCFAKFTIHFCLFVCLFVCLFTERTVSEVTSNRDEVEEANQTLHGNFKLEYASFFSDFNIKSVFFYKSSFFIFLFDNYKHFRVSGTTEKRKHWVENKTWQDRGNIRGIVNMHCIIRATMSCLILMYGFIDHHFSLSLNSESLKFKNKIN